MYSTLLCCIVASEIVSLSLSTARLKEWNLEGKMLDYL
jgi:hypothetical protein